MGPKAALRLIAAAKRAHTEGRKSCLIRGIGKRYTNVTIRVGNYDDGSRRYLAVSAHRFIFEKVVGPIPSGVFVLHSCDVPACVNPCHLFLGDAAANSLDMVSKDRHARGERSKIAKITAADVVRIRELAEEGMLRREIAVQFGLKAPQIGAIILRKAWKHIP